MKFILISSLWLVVNLYSFAKGSHCYVGKKGDSGIAYNTLSRNNISKSEAQVATGAVIPCCEGYQFDETYICNPICALGCPEPLECVEPNTCRCPHKYEMKTNGCQPINGSSDGVNLDLSDVSSTTEITTTEIITEQFSSNKTLETTKSVETSTFVSTEVHSSCANGFVYQEDNGCVPHCEQNCVNGFCAAPGKCECLGGFYVNHKNSFECVPVIDQIAEKTDFSSLIWIVLIVLVIVILALLLIAYKFRKHNYNVYKAENKRHTAQFVNEC